jgi:hypothetical protein
MGYIFLDHAHMILLFTPTMTGPGVQTLGDPLLDYVLILGIILCLGHQNGNPLFPSPVQKAEYRGIANVVAKSSWLCQLLTELGHPPQHAKIVFYDNVSASYMSTQPVEHQRTKHIEIDLHFVRDKVSPGEIKVLHVPSSKHIEIDLHFVRDKVSLDEIKVLHVPSSSQYVDIFTKGLLMTLFLRVQIQPELVPLSTLRGVLAHVFVL